MRPLEGVFLLVLAAALGLSVQRARSWAYSATVASVAIAGAHGLVEGIRWQMAPAYGTVIALAVVRAAQWRAAERRVLRRRAPRRLVRWARGLGLGIGGGAIVGSAAAALLFPVFQLPTPSGPHAVGTTTVALVDSSRDERFTPTPTDHRELVVQAWYPAPDSAQARRERYTEQAALGHALAHYLDIPRFVFNHLSLVRTHSRVGVPVASGDAPYPVVLFSHGYGLGFATQNTAQMEDLASHGYVVLSISHTYEALATLYPEGRTVTFDIDRIQAAYGEGLKPLYRRFRQSDDLSRRRALFRKMRSVIASHSLPLWTRDIRFVLDWVLRGPHAASPLSASVVDGTRVGFFGMSFGGAAAVRACQIDRRCDASLNLDGLQGPDRGALTVPPSNGDTAPTLFMYSAPHDGRNAPVYGALSGSVYTLTVANSRHYNFSDFSVVSPLFRLMNVLGSIPGTRMLRLLNTSTRTFFNASVKQQSPPTRSPVQLPEDPNLQFRVPKPPRSDS